jgi:hypothetical protein
MPASVVARLAQIIAQLTNGFTAGAVTACLISTVPCSMSRKLPAALAANCSCCYLCCSISASHITIRLSSTAVSLCFIPILIKLFLLLL